MGLSGTALSLPAAVASAEPVGKIDQVRKKRLEIPFKAAVVSPDFNDRSIEAVFSGNPLGDSVQSDIDSGQSGVARQPIMFQHAGQGVLQLCGKLTLVTVQDSVYPFDERAKIDIGIGGPVFGEEMIVTDIENNTRKSAALTAEQSATDPCQIMVVGKGVGLPVKQNTVGDAGRETFPHRTFDEIADKAADQKLLR